MDTHRKICNEVKKCLLNYSTINVRNVKNKNITLLDLCSGRGGDIYKWCNLGINFVIGIDNDVASINEAIKRNKSRPKSITKICFYLDDVENADFNKYIYKNNKNTSVDIISCQFALHYFKNLDTLLLKISNSLKFGGYFIGITADGDVIKDKICNNIKEIPGVYIKYNDENSYMFNIETQLTIETKKDTKSDEISDTKKDEKDTKPDEISDTKKYEKDTKPDEISDTKKSIENDNTQKHHTTDDYFKFRAKKDSQWASLEYYVFKNDLKQKAKKYNLELVGEMNNLKNTWNGNDISELYFSFIFKKV